MQVRFRVVLFLIFFNKVALRWINIMFVRILCYMYMSIKVLCIAPPAKICERAVGTRMEVFILCLCTSLKESVVESSQYVRFVSRWSAAMWVICAQSVSCSSFYKSHRCKWPGSRSNWSCKWLPVCCQVRPCLKRWSMNVICRQQQFNGRLFDGGLSTLQW